MSYLVKRKSCYTLQGRGGAQEAGRAGPCYRGPVRPLQSLDGVRSRPPPRRVCQFLATQDFRRQPNGPPIGRRSLPGGPERGPGLGGLVAAPNGLPPSGRKATAARGSATGGRNRCCKLDQPLIDALQFRGGVFEIGHRKTNGTLPKTGRDRTGTVAVSPKGPDGSCASTAGADELKNSFIPQPGAEPTKLRAGLRTFRHFFSAGRWTGPEPGAQIRGWRSEYLPRAPAKMGRVSPAERTRFWGIPWTLVPTLRVGTARN